MDEQISYEAIRWEANSDSTPKHLQQADALLNEYHIKLRQDQYDEMLYNVALDGDDVVGVGRLALKPNQGTLYLFRMPDQMRDELDIGTLSGLVVKPEYRRANTQQPISEQLISSRYEQAWQDGLDVLLAATRTDSTWIYDQSEEFTSLVDYTSDTGYDLQVFAAFNPYKQPKVSEQSLRSICEGYRE